jgi:hypothetical protein
MYSCKEGDVIRGKVARQLRKMIDYPSKGLRNPDGEQLIGTNAYHVRTAKGQKFVLNPEGEHQVGELRYDVVDATKDIYELRCDPIRLIYKQLKKEYRSFTLNDMRRVQREEKSSPLSAEMQEE